MRGWLAGVALLVAVSSALAADPDVPDAAPNLPLQRDDGAGGLASGWVQALAPHPEGGMIVGGEFVQAGVPRTHLLRVLPDGSLDPDFDTAITSNGAARVDAIAVAPNAIYIGGAFQNVEGVPREGLAKLDLQGNLVAAFDAGLTGNDEIHALALGEGKVYAGGGIVAGDAWGLARFDAQSGARDTRWRAQTQTRVLVPAQAGARGRVHALLHTGTDLIVGGNFEQIAGQPRRYAARLSLQASDGEAAVLPYSVNLSGIVRAIARDAGSGQVYLGGRFFVGPHDNLVRTAADGTVDGGFQPDPRAEVSALALARGRLYYGGDFRVDTATPLYLARTPVTGNGLPDAGWLPLPDAHVKALVWEAGAQRLWLGGRFTAVGEAPRAGLARISFAGPDTIFRDGLED